MKEYNIEDYLNPELSKEIIEELVKENAELKKNDCEHCKHLDLYITYKQTLQEIKNFLELPEFYLYGKETIHDRIIQKITKAEVGE